MIKKECILISVLSLSLILPFASAYSSFDSVGQQMSNVIDKVLEILAPFFEKIIGDYSSSDFFFHKILLLILLIIITKFALEKTPIADTDKTRKIGLIISILISVLAIRFINENGFFEAIFVQYGVLGIAITTILPMVIFFYFIHNLKVNTFGRKAFWTLYLVMLSGIWISKASEIPSVAHKIYWVSMAAVLVFILFDKKIHGYFGLSDLNVFMSRQKRDARLNAEKRLGKLHDMLTTATAAKDRASLLKDIRAEEKLIKDLYKED